jgi:hypothetical protein
MFHVRLAVDARKPRLRVAARRLLENARQKPANVPLHHTKARQRPQ